MSVKFFISNFFFKSFASRLENLEKIQSDLKNLLEKRPAESCEEIVSYIFNNKNRYFFFKEHNGIDLLALEGDRVTTFSYACADVLFTREELATHILWDEGSRRS